MKLTKINEFKFWLKVFKRQMNFESFKWRSLNYSSPSPQHIKIRILKSNSLNNATWVETGTYLGDTTLKLSKIAKNVISIEPQYELSVFASTRLKRFKNVEIINATSENCISGVLEIINGPTCFWLDGHYSGDVTFLGSNISPISYELATIANYLKANEVVVFVDDFRLFVNSKHTGYPPHDTLVKWAVENNLSWTVEQDIFIAKSKF